MQGLGWEAQCRADLSHLLAALQSLPLAAASQSSSTERLQALLKGRFAPLDDLSKPPSSSRSASSNSSRYLLHKLLYCCPMLIFPRLRLLSAKTQYQMYLLLQGSVCWQLIVTCAFCLTDFSLYHVLWHQFCQSCPAELARARHVPITNNNPCRLTSWRGMSETAFSMSGTKIYWSYSYSLLHQI